MSIYPHCWSKYFFHSNLAKNVLEELVKSMEMEDVQAYLRHINLEEYAPAFKDNDIDGLLLLEVLQNEAAMKELGVRRALHRIRIEKKLLEYAKEHSK